MNSALPSDPTALFQEFFRVSIPARSATAALHPAGPAGLPEHGTAVQPLPSVAPTQAAALAGRVTALPRHVRGSRARRGRCGRVARACAGGRRGAERGARRFFRGALAGTCVQCRDEVHEEWRLEHTAVIKNYFSPRSTNFFGSSICDTFTMMSRKNARKQCVPVLLTATTPVCVLSP